MTKLEIVVPDILARFESEKKEEVLLGAIRHVALAKLKEEKKELKEALGHIRRYEKKYKMPFSKFEKYADIIYKVEYRCHIIKKVWRYSRQRFF